MSCLPQLREELVRAARAPDLAQPELRRSTHADARAPGRAEPALTRVRWRRAGRLRWVAVNVAIGLAGTLVGLNAAGVFHRGAALGPALAPSPTSNEGVAIPGSVRLLGLRVADPGGGLPWGLRVARTTRGLTCVQAGRVDYGTIGVLGQDGAFRDDRRFHPISDDVFDNLGCVLTDARGHAFVNVALRNWPASGLPAAEARAVGGCSVEPTSGPLARFLARSRRRLRTPSQPRCPAGDLREVYFGLLGPQARSITYRSPGGGLRTTPTFGADGAYLLVLPQATSGCLAPLGAPGRPRSCRYGSSGDTGGPEIAAGAIAAVSYRDGHVCHVAAPGTPASLFGSCPPVGYVAPHTRTLTSAELRTPIGVRELPARRYCTKGAAIEPCDAGVPPGYRPVAGGPPSLLVQVSFVSRVAITSSASWYEVELSYPHSRGCSIGGSGGPTNSDLRAGQRVSMRMLVPYSCPGTVQGRVTYVPTVGEAGAMPVTGLPGQGKQVPVGRFAFTVPRGRG